MSGVNIDGMSRSDLVYFARLAEQGERYEDMVAYMQAVAKQEQQLSVDERNLLSVAYKNVIGARRASWRVMSAIEAKESGKGESGRVANIAEYRVRIEKELDGMCGEILQIIQENLIPAVKSAGTSDTTAEAMVFYYKMAGDYQRYLAEFKEGEDRKTCAGDALSFYNQAKDWAEKDDGLPPTHPIRLGLALNLSVFYYEILSEQEMACDLAKKAFDSAIAELDSLQEDSYKDATLIMQLLRDNLTLWTSEGEGEN